MAPPDLRPLLDRVPGARAVYLFGSRAGGAGRPDSDLDLAVLPPRPLGAVERFDAQEALAAALGVDVDLVDLLSASTVMRAEVLRTGRVVYDADPTARALAAPSPRGLGGLDDVGLRAAQRRSGRGSWTTSASGAACMADDVALSRRPAQPASSARAGRPSTSPCAAPARAGRACHRPAATPSASLSSPATSPPARGADAADGQVPQCGCT